MVCIFCGSVQETTPPLTHEQIEAILQRALKEPPRPIQHDIKLLARKADDIFHLTFALAKDAPYRFLHQTSRGLAEYTLSAIGMYITLTMRDGDSCMIIALSDFRSLRFRCEGVILSHVEGDRISNTLSVYCADPERLR